jgi:predicted nucleic acid-binding protein
VTDIKCLDSSTWISYFFEESKEGKEIIEGEFTLVTSSLSLFEIKKKLLSLKKDPKPALDFVKKRGNIVVPGTIIAERAAEISVERKLPAVDAIIYVTALISNSELITEDNDFRGLDGVKVI